MFGSDDFIGRAKIRINSIVGQDHSAHYWEGQDIIFDVFSFMPGRLRLEADGYGKLTNGRYGNGALYVQPKDLIGVIEEEIPPFPV